MILTDLLNGIIAVAEVKVISDFVKKHKTTRRRKKRRKHGLMKFTIYRE